jgi:putative intracellular protease/amidase
MNKLAYVYITNTMSDWETGYLTAELNTGRGFKPTAPKYSVQTVSLTSDPIVTMGGMRIIPDTTLDNIDFENADLLILPGGETWLNPMHKPLFAIVDKFLKNEKTVAAICGATMALAQQGFLNNRRHTSNDLSFLQTLCPNYKGEKYYVRRPAVSDKNLITASGAAPLDFACQILKTLELFRPETLDAWYNLFQTHDIKYFHEILNSME